MKMLKTRLIILMIMICSALSYAQEAADMPSLTKGDYGLSFVTWYGDASVAISYGVSIYIDPVNIPDNSHKADAILITHPHSENFSIADISKLLGGYTHIYGPADVIEILREAKIKVGEDQLHVVAPFDEVVTGSYQFKTVPAYSNDNDLHPAGSNWVGYIVTIFTPRGESELYFSGDTGNIPEIEGLNGNVDIAFISINPEHGMPTVIDAVNAVTLLDPEIAVPLRYSGNPGSDGVAQEFVGMLYEVDGIDGVMLNKK